MNKLKTIIDLVNQGDKAKLWKYLNKGIYSKKDKIDVIKSLNTNSGDSEEQEITEGTLLYYSGFSIPDLKSYKDQITELAVLEYEYSNGGMGDSEYVTTNRVYKWTDNEIWWDYTGSSDEPDYKYVKIGYNGCGEVSGFIFKVGSDVQTLEDLGFTQFTRITKSEYDNIFIA